jgi:hypothetical protein
MTNLRPAPATENLSRQQLTLLGFQYLNRAERALAAHYSVDVAERSATAMAAMATAYFQAAQNAQRQDPW